MNIITGFKQNKYLYRHFIAKHPAAIKTFYKIISKRAIIGDNISLISLIYLSKQLIHSMDILYMNLLSDTAAYVLVD